MSTYSTNLGIELIGTGEQAGTWGTTTNTNLGTLIEQAISGYVQYSCTGGTDTITIPDGATGTARNMFLELTGTGGGTLVVPAKKKLYFIYNNTGAGAAVTVKVSGQTGVSVPDGKKMLLVNNGTDVVNATNYMAALSLGSALPVASGGTGGTTASDARTNLGLGTIATQAANNVSITGGSITGITDLAVADGGTGASTAADARTNLGIVVYDVYTGSTASNVTFPVGSYLPVVNFTGVYTKYNNSTFTVYRGDDAGAYVYTDLSTIAGATALTGTWAVRGSTNYFTLRGAPSGNNLVYLMQRIS